MGVTLDWDWAKRTGGNLSPQEYRHLVGVTLRQVPGALATSVRYRMGKTGTGRADLTEVPVPDSALARHAEEFVHAALPAYVVMHSYRTYFLGKVFASLGGVTVDDEHTYLAALLHDVNLGHPTPERCFAVTGGERVERLLTEWGADKHTAESVAAATGGHLTVGADHDLSDPAGFVHAGSVADITGRRLDEIDPEWLAELQRTYPRHHLKRHLVPALRAEGKAVPHGRMHLVNRWAALPLLVRIAPYQE
jgi:hypothetical protein